jgi:glycerol-3-phosphate O-acyltransferase
MEVKSENHGEKSQNKKIKGDERTIVGTKPLPLIEGPLSSFNQKRPLILKDVVEDSLDDFKGASQDLLLGEALYQERARLKSELTLSPSLPFTYRRLRRDRKLLRSIYGGLLKNPVDADRNVLLERLLWHYADEIGGRFHPSIYRLAVHAVPFGFNWLLNAASVRQFLPWKMTEALEGQLKLVGEVEHLQKLSKKGTILLVPTHQSNVDSLLVGYVIYLMGLPPFSYGAGLNLYSNPVLAFFMSRLGAYTVDRKKRNELYKATLKNYSTRILTEGVHSIFFPGGGRSRSGAIESNLKLGLLGTGLKAQIHNLQAGKERSSIYVVPMTTSYHFTLEARSLVEKYLQDVGKHQFMGADREETLPLIAGSKFFWKLFSSKTEVMVRVGKPLDVFGNLVNEEGQSMGPNGLEINPRRWLMSRGELCEDEPRDREYTQRLGSHLVDRYYRDNTVLSSHAAAFTYFSALRRKYPELNLYRFLRLSKAQRTLQWEDVLREARRTHDHLHRLAQAERLHLSGLMQLEPSEWFEDGIRHLGLLHRAKVIRKEEGVVWTEDMNLLYYYRNRLSGYGLSILSDSGRPKDEPGVLDEKGFLA